MKQKHTNEKFEVEWLLKQITPHGNGLTLKSIRPKDGIAGYVWRMIRFHSGKDIHNPTSCYFHLFEQLKKDDLLSDDFFGLINDGQKEILNDLDALVVKCTNKLGLSNFAASHMYKGTWY